MKKIIIALLCLLGHAPTEATNWFCQAQSSDQDFITAVEVTKEEAESGALKKCIQRGHLNCRLYTCWQR